MNKVSWFENNPKKTLIVIVFIAFLISDFLCGYFLLPDKEGIRNSYYHHTLKKRYHGYSKWGENYYSIYTNSLGFKDSKIREISVSDYRHRILIIGDSFSEGIGYPYEKTFVGIVDKKLDTSMFEILNASVRTYSPKLYYLKIKYLIEKIGLKFNELFIYIDISDIQDEFVYESFVPSSRSFLEKVLRKIELYLTDNFYTYNKIIRYLLQRIYYRSEDATQKQGISNNNIDVDAFLENYYQERGKWTSEKIFRLWGETGLRLAEISIKKLVYLCEKNGIEATIAVYPWPFQIMNGELDSIQVRFWETFAKENGVGFINYFPVFINGLNPEDTISKYFITEDVHWNDKGHELIADKLLKRIQKNIHNNNREK